MRLDHHGQVLQASPQRGTHVFLGAITVPRVFDRILVHSFRCCPQAQLLEGELLELGVQPCICCLCVCGRLDRSLCLDQVDNLRIINSAASDTNKRRSAKKQTDKTLFKTEVKGVAPY